jgi:hypothetical protein
MERSPSCLKSSRAFRSRKARPSISLSAMKSIDHDLDGKSRNQRFFRLFASQMLAGFNPRVKSRFPIDPINPLMIPDLSLHVAQI